MSFELFLDSRSPSVPHPATGRVHTPAARHRRPTKIVGRLCQTPPGGSFWPSPAAGAGARRVIPVETPQGESASLCCMQPQWAPRAGREPWTAVAEPRQGRRHRFSPAWNAAWASAAAPGSAGRQSGVVAAALQKSALPRLGLRQSDCSLRSVLSARCGSLSSARPGPPWKAHVGLAHPKECGPAQSGSWIDSTLLLLACYGLNPRFLGNEVSG